MEVRADNHLREKKSFTASFLSKCSVVTSENTSFQAKKNPRHVCSEDSNLERGFERRGLMRPVKFRHPAPLCLSYLCHRSVTGCYSEIATNGRQENGRWPNHVGYLACFRNAGFFVCCRARNQL